MDENKVLWRIWVDTRQRIVSFHEAEGYELLEFRSQELFSAASTTVYRRAVPLSLRAHKMSPSCVFRKRGRIIARAKL